MAKKHKRTSNGQQEARVLPPMGAERYVNRALSWLEFNRRVLGEALSRRHPLLERVKFLAIVSSNLDEFFMVRIAGIRDQRDAGVMEPSPDGLVPAEQLKRIKPVVEDVVAQQRRCWIEDVAPQLRAHGVWVCDYPDLSPAQRNAARDLFYDEIFPVLTPLAFDPGHPFPHISNLSLNLAVVIHDPQHGERFARVKVPEVLPRLVALPGPDGVLTLAWLEQIIAAHLEALFPGMEVREAYPFRVTRDADVELEEDEEAADLLRTMESGIRQRQFGHVIRLTVDTSMPTRILDLLIENLEITRDDVYCLHGPLGLRSLLELTSIDRPDLKDAPFVPHVPAALSNDDLFAAIRRGDILLHHPYDSFMPVVEWIAAAAEDPQVLAIKQTLYRIGSDTSVVDALMRARGRGKQVTVLVELKARFDEENNIGWAKQLERAGVHVVYGLVGLKTHCKLALVVRKEGRGLRRYVHLSTGNYNVTTTRLYTDIGLLSCDADVGADASELFNYLTGYSAQRTYRVFSLAPVSLRQTMLQLIEREIAQHTTHGGGKVILKMNVLTDPEVIDALYRASQAGVEIDVIVRGVCCLRPGVAGLSETIRVRSIIGRFLEHSRMYYFHNGGEDEVYLGSGDFMSRTLDWRVELMFPVRQPDLVHRVRDEILAVHLRDTVNAHILQPDGTYTRPDGDLQPFDSQAWFISHPGKGA